MPIIPDNHNTSAAMKNTLDYFLEEYYFKPSAIVSYSPGFFGRINAAQQLRLVFAELPPPQPYRHHLRSPQSMKFSMTRANSKCLNTTSDGAIYA